MAYKYEYTMKVKLSVTASSEEEALEVAEERLEKMSGDVEAETLLIESLDYTDDPELLDELDENPHMTIEERNK